MQSSEVHFVIKKLLRALVILLGVTLITFLLMHAIPGNPWDNYSSSPRAMMNLSTDRATLRELNRRFGLNLPLWRQFTRYVIGDWGDDGKFFCGAVCGNLGPSFVQSGRAVKDILFKPSEGKPAWDSRFGYSIRLVGLGTLFAVGLGIPIGIFIAGRQRSLVSRAVSVLLAALIAIPNFVIGLLAIILLASRIEIIKVLPDWNYPEYWIVPGLVLAFMPMASIARVTQTSLLNVIGEDYIRTARAKGVPQRRVMMVHVMRNALVPIITFLGPVLMEMFTGLLIVENLYSFPGFGREYWTAVLQLDYTMIMALTLIYASGILLVNGMIELVSMGLDPRIRAASNQGVP